MPNRYMDGPVLGIETSCDETAAAVFDGGRLRSNIVARHQEHEIYGGIVPELASRAHAVLMRPTVDRALDAAGLTVDDLAGVAATHAPGLIGSLLVGLTFAKGLAAARNLPFIGVNHMEAHLVSVLLTHPEAEPPLVALLVSGGHTEIVHVPEWHRYRILGSTRDDAAGEAFDKTAVLLGEGYPGGPHIDRLAALGDSQAFAFPRAWLEPGSLDFSFSGLKTAVRLAVAEQSPLTDAVKADVAASFQAAVVEVLVGKLERAAKNLDVGSVVVAGGVAANRDLRRELQAAAERRQWATWAPELRFCGDNAAMVALAGSMRLARGERSGWDLPAWPTLEQSGFAAP